MVDPGAIALPGLVTARLRVADGPGAARLASDAGRGHGIVCSLFASRAARDPRWVARRIEAKHPELAAALLAAVEQNVEVPLRAARLPANRRDPSGPRAWPPQRLESRRYHQDYGPLTTGARSGPGLLLLASAALAGQVYTRASDRTKPVPAAQAFDVEVEPGSTEIERGTSLLVVAPFQGDGAPAREHGDRRLAPGSDQTGQ